MRREELHDGLYALIEFDHWVCWKEVNRKGKGEGEVYATKCPIDPKTLRRAKVSDDKTWDTFDRAVSVDRPDILGVGYVITRDDDFTCIDLDWKGQAQTPFQDIPIWAKRIIRWFRSYTEWSPSGFGCHIWIRGKIPQGARNRSVEKNVEIYSSDRFVTVTNERIAIVETTLHVDDAPVLTGADTSEIEDRETHLQKFHNQLFGEQDDTAIWGASQSSTSGSGTRDHAGAPLAPYERRWTAEEAIEIVSSVWRDDLPCPYEVIDAACDNDPDFFKLWRRKPDAKMKNKLGEDHSAWDMAFCNKLYAMCMTWEEICASMREYRRKHVGDGKSIRPDYIARTIAAVSNRHEDVRKDKDVDDTANVLIQQHVSSAPPSVMLDTFNSVFDTERGKVSSIRYHQNSDLLTIQFLDGREANSDIMAVRTHAAFDRILNQYQQVVNPWKPKNWAKAKQALLDALEVVEDQELGLNEQGREILKGWVSQFPSIPPFNETTYDTGGPWIIQGRVHFEFRSVHAYCVSNQLLRSTEKRVILAAIKSHGQCGCKKIATRSRDGTRLHKSVYVVVDDRLNRELLKSKGDSPNIIRFPGRSEDDDEEGKEEQAEAHEGSEEV